MHTSERQPAGSHTSVFMRKNSDDLASWSPGCTKNLPWLALTKEKKKEEEKNIKEVENKYD